MKKWIHAVLFGCCWALGGISYAGAYEDYFFAIGQDNATVVDDLIHRGFDPNTLDPAGQHGLLLALRLKSMKVAQALARVPTTDIEVRSAQDESPLMLAALHGQLELSTMLVERNADVNKSGWAPLHYAATGGHVAVMHMLLEHHAYVDAESPNSSTPLMMAAMYGSVDAVRVLLEAGADPSIKNDWGLTALDFAKKGLKPDSVDLLTAFMRKKATGGSW